MPSVAVVIPLYNHEVYIAAAIQSVLRQSVRVEKIVVIDDGSSDKSVEAVAKIADDRIRLIAQENAGAHAALNRGIEEAGSCDYIGILNSDDLYEPARVEKCLRFFEENHAVEVVCTNLQLIDEVGNALDQSHHKARRSRTVWAAKRDLPAWLGIANFAKTSSNFFGRADYFRSHPFREYRFVHDYFFLAVCALERKLGVLDEPLLQYRVHGTNTIKSSGAAEVARETLRMNLDLLRELSPQLGGSAKMRRDYADYFRALSGNHADFRLEVFLEMLSRNAMDMLVPDFPELSEKPSRALKVELANAALLRSKWVKLGRKLGFLKHE